MTEPIERDPHGIDPHTPGAKLDAGKVQVALIFDHMPRALSAVAEVATFGAGKYTPGGWRQVPDGITRYRNAGDRHRLARGIDACDADSTLLHLAHEAWNRLAELELYLMRMEAHHGQP